MTVGIQCWDAAGNLILDWTDQVAKILGVLNIGQSYTGSQQTGTINDTRFTSLTGHTPFFTVIQGDTWNALLNPQIYISGNTLTWYFPHASLRPDTKIVYGAA
jgi:hypothetical protein